MAEQIGNWVFRQVDSDSADKAWVNTETGQTIPDSPMVRRAIENGATDLTPAPATDEEGAPRTQQGLPGVWDPGAGKVVAINPYTTEPSKLEKMYQTTGPHTGQYLYIDENGNSAYGLAAFNKLTGKNYTDAQIPASETQLDADKGNSGGSWFDKQGGDIMIDVVRGVLGFVSGGMSELLFSLAGPEDDARGARSAQIGGLGGVAGNLFGGTSNTAASGASASEAGAESSAPSVGEQTTGLSSSPGQTTGIAETPAEALNVQPMSAEPPAAPAENVEASLANSLQGGSEATVPSVAPATTQSTGLIDQVLKFGNDNKTLTSGLMQIGGGLLKGIGENERTNKLIAARKDLENQRVQNQMNLQEFMRRFTQSGSYFDAALPFKPGTNPVRRMSGAPVYTDTGLIARGMR